MVAVGLRYNDRRGYGKYGRILLRHQTCQRLYDISDFCRFSDRYGGDWCTQVQARRMGMKEDKILKKLSHVSNRNKDRRLQRLARNRNPAGSHKRRLTRWRSIVCNLYSPVTRQQSQDSSVSIDSKDCRFSSIGSGIMRDVLADCSPHRYRISPSSSQIWTEPSRIVDSPA